MKFGKVLLLGFLVWAAAVNTAHAESVYTYRISGGTLTLGGTPGAYQLIDTGSSIVGTQTLAGAPVSVNSETLQFAKSASLPASCSIAAPCKFSGIGSTFGIGPGLSSPDGSFAGDVQVATGIKGAQYEYTLAGLFNGAFDHSPAQGGLTSVTFYTNTPLRNVGDKAAISSGIVTLHIVPEPGTLAMLGVGLIGLFGIRGRVLR